MCIRDRYENAENNPMTMSSLKDMITSNKMEWNNSTLILEVVVNFININVANKNEIEFNIGICKNEMQYAIQNSTDNIEYRLIYEILHSNIFDTYWTNIIASTI